jgi:hypothetical protein
MRLLARLWQRILRWLKGGRMTNENQPSFRDEYVENIEVGEGETYDEAVRDGYQRLSDRGKPPPYRIVEVYAVGDNPFSGYRAVMR